MAEGKNISPEEMEEEILENEEINDAAEEETVEEAEEAAAEEPEAGKEKGSFFKKKEKKDKKDEKIEELTDRVRRQMAEFDNFRKSPVGYRKRFDADFLEPVIIEYRKRG